MGIETYQQLIFAVDKLNLRNQNPESYQYDYENDEVNSSQITFSLRSISHCELIAADYVNNYLRPFLPSFTDKAYSDVLKYAFSMIRTKFGAAGIPDEEIQIFWVAIVIQCAILEIKQDVDSSLLRDYIISNIPHRLIEYFVKSGYSNEFFLKIKDMLFNALTNSIPKKYDEGFIKTYVLIDTLATSEKNQEPEVQKKDKGKERQIDAQANDKGKESQNDFENNDTSEKKFLTSEHLTEKGSLSLACMPGLTEDEGIRIAIENSLRPPTDQGEPGLDSIERESDAGLDEASGDDKSTIEERSEEIQNQYEAFQQEIKVFIAKTYAGEAFNDEELNALQQIEKESNTISLLEPTVLFAEQNKIFAGLKDYFFPSSSDTRGAFKEKVMPGELPLGQYGTLSTLPLVVQPAQKDKYIFPRSELFNNKSKRIEFLNTYYLFALQHKDYKMAARAVLVLFSHVVKHFLSTGAKNRTAFKIFLNHELKKCGMPQMPRPVTVQITKLFLGKFPIGSNLFFASPKISDSIPNQGSEIENAPEESNVEVKKKRHQYRVNPKQQINDLSPSAELLVSDTDVFDAETGDLVLSFRKKRISPQTVHEFRDELVKLPKIQLHKFGPRRADDKVDNDDLSRKRDKKGYDSHTAIIGMTSNPQCASTSSTKLTLLSGNTQLLTAGGKVMQEIEYFHQKISPAEYTQVKKTMEPLQELTLPYCNTYTTIDVNYDKQTFGHVDSNNFPHFRLRGLTVFWPDGVRRYTGAYTYFPNYDVAVDLEEGDILLAPYDMNIHCNTSLVKTSESKSESNPEGYYRISAVGFTKGLLLERAHREAFENSDAEDEVDLRRSDSIHYVHHYHQKPYPTEQDPTLNESQRKNTQHYFIDCANEQFQITKRFGIKRKKPPLVRKKNKKIKSQVVSQNPWALDLKKLRFIDKSTDEIVVLYDDENLSETQFKKTCNKLHRIFDSTFVSITKVSAESKKYAGCFIIKAKPALLSESLTQFISSSSKLPLPLNNEIKSRMARKILKKAMAKKIKKHTDPINWEIVQSGKEPSSAASIFICFDPQGESEDYPKRIRNLVRHMMWLFNQGRRFGPDVQHDPYSGWQLKIEPLRKANKIIITLDKPKNVSQDNLLACVQKYCFPINFQSRKRLAERNKKISHQSELSAKKRKMDHSVPSVSTAGMFASQSQISPEPLVTSESGIKFGKQ